MSRAQLLTGLSLIALSFLHTKAFAASAPTTAPTAIQGGGATAPEGDYLVELATYNATTANATFSTYWGAGSGVGQQAFINDDLTCDIDKVTGASSSKCANAPGGANTVHYGTSDNPLTSTAIATWATSSFGQSLAGNLIQLPAIGTAEEIVINDTNVTSNGQLQLSDSDLCGIFSGLITDFSQITDSGTGGSAFHPTAGQFKLVYRSDSAGPTFILTNHLARVCTTANTKPGITFSAVTTFANIFTAAGGISTVIPNSIGESLNQGVANYLAGLSNGTVAQGIGYVSPDWTSLAPNSAGLLSNGKNSPLLVAAIYNGKKSFLGTTANITTGLAHGVAGVGSTNLKPPASAADAANPALWIPTIGTTSTGYPIVGYSTIDLAQCYSSKAIKTSLLAYLNLHFTNASYAVIQGNNGLVPVSKSAAANFLATIKKAILTNKNKWNDDIGDTTVCAKVAGR